MLLFLSDRCRHATRPARRLIGNRGFYKDESHLTGQNGKVVLKPRGTEVWSKMDSNLRSLSL
jgi:hypothetical protein